MALNSKGNHVYCMHQVSSLPPSNFSVTFHETVIVSLDDFISRIFHTAMNNQMEMRKK